MTDEEYNIRISKIKNKKNQLEKDINSYKLTYPPIDHTAIANRLIEELDDMIDEIKIDVFLESVDDLLREEGYLED